MKKNIILMLIFLFFSSLNAFASWTGPAEVVSGEWGSDNGQFGLRSGDITDYYPNRFCVLNDGKVVIYDSENKKWKIFNGSGIFQNSFSTPGFNLYPFNNQRIATFSKKSEGANRLGLVNLNSGAWEWKDEERNYDLKKASIEIISNNIYVKYMNKYYFYSPAGTLLQIYITRPLELGVRTFKCKQGVPTETKCDRPHYEVEYLDSVYVFETNKENMKGDLSGQIKINNNLLMDNQGGIVYAYGVTSTIPGKEGVKERKLLGFESSWKVPNDNKIFHADPENKTTGGDYEIITEYGKEAVVSPDGSIYTWMRSETNYKILKWTWSE